MNLETLPWYSGTFSMAPVSITALTETLGRLMEAVDLVYAFEYEALELNPMFLDERAGRHRFLKGEMESRKAVRGALSGSSLWQKDNGTLSGAISMKSGFAVHGAVRDALTVLKDWNREFKECSGQGERLYVTTGMSAALDMMNISLAHLSRLIVNRLLRLMSPKFSGLHEFLGQDMQTVELIQRRITGIDERICRLSTPCGLYHQAMLNERFDLSGDLGDGAVTAGHIADLIYILLAVEGYHCMEIFKKYLRRPDGAGTAVLYEQMRQSAGSVSFEQILEVESVKCLVSLLENITFDAGGGEHK